MQLKFYKNLAFQLILLLVKESNTWQERFWRLAQ